jgi:hypothetical protein
MRDAEVAHAIRLIVLKYLLTLEETTKALLACGVSRAANVAQISTGRFLSTNMQLTVQQSSAIYFKRHKGSKRRAALFRQLRASAANQTCDVEQQTFGNAHIGQRLRSGQLLLRGFEF